MVTSTLAAYWNSGYRSYQRVTPSTNGSSVTVNNGADLLMIDNTVTLTTYTVTMPSTPSDGDRLIIASAKGIMALTVSPNSGQSVINAPGAIGVSGRCEFVYFASATKWLCISAERGRIAAQPKVADFTWINQQSASIQDNPFALGYVFPASTAGANLLTKSTPASTNFSVVGVFSLDAMEYPAGNVRIGIWLGNSASGRRIVTGPGAIGTGGSGLVIVERYTGTAFTSAILDVDAVDPPRAVRIDVSATTLSFYNGQDGYNWRNTPIVTETISNFINATIDQCGIFAWPNNSWQTGQVLSFDAFVNN